MRYAPNSTSGVRIGPNGTATLGYGADQLNSPFGFAFDSAECQYFSLIKGTTTLALYGSWNTNGVTYAGGHGVGSSANQFWNPYDMAFDSSNNMHIADYTNCRIQRWSLGASTGITIAGSGGCGSSSNQLLSPTGVAIDSYGNVYAADSGHRRIQRWSAGASVGVSFAININCFGIFISISGYVYISDTGLHAIVRYSSTGGNGISVAGSNGLGSAMNQFNSPYGLHVDANNYIYVADSANHRVQRWSAFGSTGVTLAGGNGIGSGLHQLNTPTSVTRDSHGTRLAGQNRRPGGLLLRLQNAKW
ncbi:unnamed protein product [Didymodactylos carnosus]|uniref:NHL repeat containing protein n=1 Tax=Didymodactylos carnosus TaxID=1234261 RepID=A0A8S2IU31_9BILA|nr:unnamed protein product [Didymodactylos carnosus]CAF3760838.1 unnamed protein product [Didymodactylos carnosus]